MENAKAKVKETVQKVQESVQKAETETDNFLIRLADSKITVFILGGAVGVAGAFFLLVC